MSTTTFLKAEFSALFVSHGAKNYISPTDHRIVGPTFQKHVSPSKFF